MDKYKALKKRYMAATVSKSELFDEIDRLRAEVEALKSWRRIETAPQDGSLLLVGWWQIWPQAEWKQELSAAGNLDTGRPGTRWQHGQATHWMPLPEPPVLRGEGGEVMADNNQLGVCSTLCDCVCSVTDDGKCAALRELRIEVEVLRKCCTQRGARMQIMRNWMDSQYGIGPPTEWWYFCEEIPKAKRWFDADGVPVEYAALRGEV